jgi:ABC-2 type transport system permease protein
MNLVTLPMTVLSGVFFSASHFPGWMQPLLKALPLTALIDGLRAVAIDGAGAGQLLKPALILVAWGVGSFAVALRIFRWV